ncbi:PREDICTED: extensin-like [Cyprinodon variegatus]|uniref:extensin-like n=1 Tax=Cyprinodon variegatus TaxID=28743 RepID=UPI0007428FAE|nr:PREDICTED: extensin-like [Cyprinodon variegatus]
MPAPRGATGTSLRSPPAASHPEVGLGNETAPPTDRRNTPAPRNQAPTTDPNTQRDRTPHTELTQEQKGRPAPNRKSRPQLTQPPPPATKRSEQRRSPTRRSQSSTAASAAPLPPAPAPDPRPRHFLRLRPAPAGATPTPTSPQPHPPQSSGTKQLHHASKWENPPENPISASSPSTPSTRRQQDPHPTGPPAPRENRYANPPQKKNAKQKSPHNATLPSPRTDATRPVSEKASPRNHRSEGTGTENP